MKYYEDFKERIPREEISLIEQRIRKTANEVFADFKDHYTMEICGSYRRGKATSGDIDILFTRTDNKSIKGMCEKLVV